MTNKVLHWSVDHSNRSCSADNCFTDELCNGKGYWAALEDMTDKAIREDHDWRQCPICKGDNNV